MPSIDRGTSRVRSEDAALITGRGRFLADLEGPAPAILKLLRSPYAAGRIKHIDTGAAAAMPGVLAVITAADLATAGYGPLPASKVPASSLHPGREAVPQPVLARDFVRYVGEPVVAVVAETDAQAAAALECVVLEIEDLPAVADLALAARDDAPAVHENVPHNLLGLLEQGDRAATDAAFESAARVVSLDLVNNRLAPNTLEPRGALATYDAEADQTVLYQGCQGVHSIRQRVLACTPIAPERLRVVCPDTGGGFGLKLFVQCETIAVLYAARALGRPVRWIGERSESFLSDLHGRDHRTHAELALDAHGRMLAMRVAIESNVGAYQSQSGALVAWFGASMTTGAYAIGACHATVALRLTNTVPLDAYRGAGRPEAMYLIERLVDKAARELRLPPDELRRRNFIAPEAFPYTAATGQVYDSGRYAALMTQCMRRADWEGFAVRRSQSEAEGRRRGIGLAYYVEVCAGYGSDTAWMEFDAEGTVQLRVGTQATGQGHATSFGQIVQRVMGIAPEAVRLIQGDTALIERGAGTGGSRTMAIGGSAVRHAAIAMHAQVQQLVAARWGVAPDAVVCTEHGVGCGEFSAGWAEVAAWSQASERPESVAPGCAASGDFTPEAGTFPNGCHICEIELDPHTGVVEILRYTVQDDVGNVINPLLLEGQIMGGLAQGLGQAMMEHAVYDPHSGQMLSASFIDYALPRARHMPNLDFDMTPVPSPRNPLGVKGAGEAGTIGAPPALVNAVVDATWDLGITHLDMPLTAHSVWQSLAAAQRRARPEAA